MGSRHETPCADSIHFANWLNIESTMWMKAS